MTDITVRYLSEIKFPKGIGYHTHTHDYWHFILSFLDPTHSANGRTTKCTCYPAGALNHSDYAPNGRHDINIMFVVNNKFLSRRLEMIPFGDLDEADLHISLLKKIMDQVRTLNPTQEFVDFALGYYFLLIAETYENSKKRANSSAELVEKALSFIDENYMLPITLEEIAAHINRTTYHLSHLFREATGKTVVEYLRSIRIKKACMMLAYSDISIDEVITSCGFNDSSYFFRVFKTEMGTTPNRYRTSHQRQHTYYDGDEASLDVPYTDPCYTYIPGARKCIMWRTPRDYFTQTIPQFD